MTTYIYGLPTGNSTLFGNTTPGLDEVMTGFAFNNDFKLGGANDQVYTGDGSATVELGAFSNVTDSVNIGGNFNTVFSGVMTDSTLSVLGGNGSNIIQIVNHDGANKTAANNINVGGFGNRIFLNGDAVNTVTSGAGNALVVIGSVNDHLFSYNPVVTLAGTGNTVNGGDENFTLKGSQGASQMTLGNGNNTVQAAGLNNRVNLGWGNNTVTSLNGHTTIRVTGNNPLYPAVNTTDNINFGTVNSSNNNVTANHGDENFNIKGGTGNSTYTLGNGDLNISTAGPGNTVTGGNGHDTFVNTNAGIANTIQFGNGNNDSIISNGAGTFAILGNGNGDSVTANGDFSFIAVGSGTGDSIQANGNNDNVSFTGSGVVSMLGSNGNLNIGPGKVAATIGDNTTVDLNGTAAGTSITSVHNSNSLFLNGNSNATINDLTSGGNLTTTLDGSGGNYTGNVVFNGFGSDLGVKIDFHSISGIGSYAQLLAHSSSDGAGGVNVALTGGGNLDLTNIIGGLNSSQFSFV